MLSINDMADFAARNKGYSVATNLDLSLPKIYKDNPETGIFCAICYLTHEIQDHGGGRLLLVKTELISRRQQLEFAWDGPLLSDDLLGIINKNYLDGMEMKHKPIGSGSTRAGFFLRGLDATLKIENHLDHPYKVRNILEVPIQSYSTK